jgi:hypothetical protein
VSRASKAPHQQAGVFNGGKPGVEAHASVGDLITRERTYASKLISQKAFIKSFCQSQFPHKFVNLFFVLEDTKNELTDLCGN